MSKQPSEMAAVVAVIDPDANAAATITSTWVPMKNFEMLMAIVMVGDMVSTSTVDFKLQQATDSSGTGNKDISGKAITQLTEAGVDDNKQAVINLIAEELDVNGGFDHVAMVMTTAAAASDSGAAMLGFEPAIAPASDNDISTVDEIVT